MKTKTAKATLTEVERMMAAKRRLIAKHKRDIDDVRQDASRQIKAIEFRIRAAQSLHDALQRGTLKP